MAQIYVSHLTFCYEGSYDNIFEDVSFEIDSDWKLGFIGRNGRGKTTFLKLLLKEHKYQGKISSPMEFDYFPFEVDDQSRQTIDIVDSINSDYEYWKLCRELSLLKIDADILYQPFSSLSLGERTKVMLAVLFLRDNNFLLIDEPTNHLDIRGRKLVSDYLKSKKGFILVSHDKRFLDNCVDHILSINKADITVQKGNFSTWQQNKTRQDNFELMQDVKLRKDIKHLERAARQTADWSHLIEATKSAHGDNGRIGHLAAKMMKRSLATRVRRDRAVDEKKKLLKNLEKSAPLAIKPIYHHTETLVRACDLSINYGDKTIFSHLDFELKRGDRIALTGKNGCGKTSLLKLILGEDISHKGELHIVSGIKISTVTQDTSYLKGGLKDFCRVNEIEESLFKAILRKMDFSRVQFEKDIIDFSEGQKKKVLLAKSLSQSAHLYIWDEPLNYIDILSRIQIEELILKHQPTMLFVEHDKEFVDTIASRIVTL